MSTTARIIDRATALVAEGQDPADAFFAAAEAVSCSEGARERAFSLFVVMLARAQAAIEEAAAAA